MSRGHRPGHRRRGHGESPPSPAGERVLVLPGEELPSQGLKPGTGTYRVGGKVYSSVIGLLQTRPPFVQVIPLSGRYIPKPGDRVVGTVTDVQTTFWLLDIGAPRWAPLHMTGTPWEVDVGDTERFLRVGDAVLVQVESLEATGRIGVTMQGEGLGKLEGGTIVRVSPARIPRIVGRGGSMIETIVRHTGAQIAVGQNGRVWVDGDPDAIRRVAEVLRMIDEHGQRSGLTDRVESFLLATQPTSDHGPEEPPVETAHRNAPASELLSDESDAGTSEEEEEEGSETETIRPDEP
ncbi:MAG TPA: exosome complex RNA-binding protein Rrp4 [Thermoplasmata archaeon]|nr:exosome complex RNA-binding protein Rrp4 [Thermoplasmata archaeon]